MKFKKVNLSKVGTRIKRLRKSNGWSQRELAEKIGVSSIAIVFWESKKNVPTLQRAFSLAYVFGVSLEYLCGLVK